MTYQKAFEIYGNPLPDIVDRRIEKELTSILGNGFAVIYLASQMLVIRSINVVIWLVRVICWVKFCCDNDWYHRS